MEYEDDEIEYFDEDEYYEIEESHEQGDSSNTGTDIGEAQSQKPSSKEQSGSVDKVFRRMLELVARLFPQAKPKESRPPARQCLHEPNYSEVKKRDDFSRLRLYDRVDEVRTDVSAKVSGLMGKGKDPTYLLPHKRRSFRVAEDDSFLSPPVMNIGMNRMAGKRMPTRESLTLPANDVTKIENALISLQENQSFSLWIISSLFNMLHEEGYTSKDPEVLRKMSDTLSSAMVCQSITTHQLTSYMVAQRREQALKHLPLSVSDPQRFRLAASSPFSRDLFDPEVLKEVTEEFKGDVATSAHVAYMSKPKAPSFNRRRRVGQTGQGPLHTTAISHQQYISPAQSTSYSDPAAFESTALETVPASRPGRIRRGRGGGRGRRRGRFLRRRQVFSE